MDKPTEFRPIIISSRLGTFNGYANEMVAYFDREDTQAGKQIRHFVLLQDSVKLMFEPWGWTNEWYVDVVRIEWRKPTELDLTDLYLDVIVEGGGPMYRAIDLDDLAEAIQEGTITPFDAAFALRTLQRFLDTRLHRSHDFPPQCVQAVWPERATNGPGTNR